MKSEESISDRYLDKSLETTKIEYIQKWTLNILIRILDNVIPLFISTILALVVAVISSTFDHVMFRTLQAIDNIGYLRYLTSFVFMTLSALIVQCIHPTARGSGIPEMKLFLANWESPRMIDYLSFKGLLTKLIGLSLSIMSGFPVGKEGPFVHIACAISYFVKFQMLPMISRLTDCKLRRICFRCNLNCIKTIKRHYLQWRLHYRRNVDVYRFLCTGCALGVACTFGAPIGGVMFSIEVTSQMFDISNYWHCFFTGMTGALIFRFLIGGVLHDKWYFQPYLKSTLPLEEYITHHFFIYIGIGVACGFLGAIFIFVYFVFFRAGQILYRILNFMCRSFSTKNTFRLPLFHPRTSSRRIIVSVLFTMIVTIVLCVGDFIQNLDFQMPLSQREQLALFFDNGEKLMEDFKIKHPHPNTSDISEEIDLMMNFENYSRPLLLFLLMKILFFCPMITCLPVPSGIFFPLIVTGACLGRLLGDLTKISSAGCAIVGAAGLSGAVTHSVSTAVIITEMTEEIQYLIPCAVAAFIGKLIAHIIAKYSIYDMIMRNRLMPYMPDEDEDVYPVFKRATASSFITSGNFISLRTNGVDAPNTNVLFCSFSDFQTKEKTNGYPTTVDSSTNDNLREILAFIYARKSEMQWKLIPVVSRNATNEMLVGYIRSESADVYLRKYFELIMNSVSQRGLWLKSASDLDRLSLESYGLNCWKNDLKYGLEDWENFLTEQINWDELLEEKPSSVTLSTRLPDILNFVQKNFLPQVFVMEQNKLRGIITRENIIEQIKKLHRQSGILAVSYRGDLLSLPMKILHPTEFLEKWRNGKQSTNQNLGGYSYAKLRTHSE